MLSPVEQGASEVLAPVRSVASWFSSTFHAKSQVTELQTEVATLTKEYAQAKGASSRTRSSKPSSTSTTAST